VAFRGGRHATIVLEYEGAAMKKPSVAIVGAGMGGLAAAAALRRVGIEVTVYEQARQFARIGAWLRERTDPDWVYGYDAWTGAVVLEDRPDLRCE
jgi:2-polyprenyl-6-methoxyphenol hydroxylase-like FAD-dependent oxidoreductase